MPRLRGDPKGAGRIYKITYGKTERVEVDFASLADEELVELLQHENQWYARTARRLLQERAAAGKLKEPAGARLRQMLASEKEAPGKLQALWALHAVGGLCQWD